MMDELRSHSPAETLQFHSATAATTRSYFEDEVVRWLWTTQNKPSATWQQNYGNDGDGRLGWKVNTTWWSPMTEDYDNATVNSTTSDSFALPYPVWHTLLIVILCAIINIGTIIGNVLVCATVFVVRRLRTPSNLLIVSLAVSDLFVALLVMPFATVYEVLARWIFSQALCDAWTSTDVLLCTSSILNLCAISIDRYFVITRPFQYAMKRTPQRMAAMIAGVWLLSAIISIPPLFGWKTESQASQCLVSQSITYQFYATIGAFYLPLIVMIVIYTRIFLVSSRIARAEARSQPSHGDGSAYPVISESTTPLRKDSELPDRLESCVAVANGHNHHGGGNGSGMPPRYSDSTQSSLQSHHAISQLSNNNNHRAAANALRFFHRSRPIRASSSRERKATKTLGVIMGAFTLCWLPFFIVALVRPFCNEPESCIPHWLNSLLLWLGYANSFLNPIIYARFNREFRTPFREFLLFRCRGINDRIRSEVYTEQFGSAMPVVSSAQHIARPTSETAVIRYHSQGQTVVKLTNGDSPPSPNSELNRGHINSIAHSISHH